MNDLSIIIVTFNSESTIVKCIDSIKKYQPEAEIVVVDNASEDKTLEKIKKLTDIKLIESNVNNGFSKANNLGVKQSTREYLCFLNPDTELLENEDLTNLIEILKKNKDYGLIGPKLILGTGTIQKSVRNLPSVFNAFKEYLLTMEGAYKFYIPKNNDLSKVESVVGACIVIKKDLFLKVGGFNEKYFLYFEDLQLCKDIRNLGYKIGYYPKIIIKHIHGVSGKNQNTELLSKESQIKYQGSLSVFAINWISRLGNNLRK